MADILFLDLLACILYFVREEYHKNLFDAGPQEVHIFFHGIRDRFVVLQQLYLAFELFGSYPWSPKVARAIQALEQSRCITRPDREYKITDFLLSSAEMSLKALTPSELEEVKEIAGEFAAKLGR